ncbi:TDT family transporter [Rheinheimera gaetbuli]
MQPQEHYASIYLPGVAQNLQGIQIAPAVVSGLAYLMLEPDSANLLIKMLPGYGCYQILIAFRLLPWTFNSGLHMGYWAFSFGVIACAQIAVLLALIAPAKHLWQFLSVLMFALANVVVVMLLGLSLLLTLRGKLIG